MNLKIERLLKELQTSLEEMTKNQKPSEEFNIFETLGVEILETRHSKFLAELLNPNGSHGCKDLFLKEFLLLDPIKEKIKDIDLFCKHVKVETEQFHIVEKNQSYIDIVLESKDTTIVIENKIYAPDQPKQLYRYHKAKENEKISNIILIYLTIDGKSPEEQSLTKSLTFDKIDLLSYETDIYKWLSSIKEFIEFENIKIIVNQYLATIEKLTNKNSKKESMMIAKQLMKDDNLKTAIKIANALPRAKAIFEMEFYKKLQEKLKDECLQKFEIYEGKDFYWKFDESDIQWIQNLRKPGAKKIDIGFNGLYFYKKLQNEKFLFLAIGDDYDYRLYCECFLNVKNDNTNPKRIRKTDFKETKWLVDDNKIQIEFDDNFPDVFFGNYNDIYLKSSQKIDDIIQKITTSLGSIIESKDFQELVNIMNEQ